MMATRWVQALGAVVFVGAMAAGYTGRLPTPHIEMRWRDIGASAAVGLTADPPELEIAMIYIGGANCAPANLPEVKQAVQRLKPMLRERVVGLGRGFATVGVSRDVDVDDGLDHLGSLGRFDEVVVGRGWLNSAIIHYVWQDLPGQAATPQIVVVERRVRGTGAGESTGFSVTDERLLLRKVGADEITAWLAAGAPFGID